MDNSERGRQLQDDRTNILQDFVDLNNVVDIPAQCTFHFGDLNIHLPHQSTGKISITLLDQKLRQDLQTVNREIIGDQDVKPVLLDVVRDNQIPEEFGRWGLLAFLCLNQSSKFYKVENIFKESRTNAETEAVTQTINVEAIKRYVKRHGNIVGLTGIAGIGKSTFGKQYLKSVEIEFSSSGKVYYNFHINLKDFEQSEKINVLQFLLRSHLPSWDHDPESDKAILKKLDDSPHVNMTLDGVDEADMPTLDKSAKAMNLYEESSPEIILKNLLSGHLLANAKKLLISRPEAFYQLNAGHKPHFVLKAIGLGKESQNDLLQKLTSSESDFKEMQKHKSLNPSAISLCYIPIFLQMFANIIFRTESKQLFFSFSNIFTKFVEESVRSPNFKQEPSQIFNLFALAYDGMQRGKFIFEMKDLRRHKIDIHGIEAFLSLRVTLKNFRSKILEGDKKYFFSHLTWQEYFTSLHLMYFTDFHDSTFQLEEHATDVKWEIVMKFLFGLVSQNVQDTLRSIFPTLPCENVESQIVCLKSLLKRLAEKFSQTCVPEVPIPMADINQYRNFMQFREFKVQNHNEMLLKICSFAYESKDVALTEAIAAYMPPVILIVGTIFPSDAIALCHVFNATTFTVSFNIGFFLQSTAFVDDALRIFLEGIGGRHKINKFHLRDWKLTDFELEKLFQHLPEMKEFALRSCDLSSDFIDRISREIAKRGHPLEMLDLSRNKMDATAIRSLTRCLSKVERLALDKINPSAEMVDLLATSIRSCDDKLHWLVFDDHTLDKQCIRNLAKCVHKLGILSMIYCDIEGSYLAPLVEAISRIPQKMEVLYLSLNKIGKTGVDHLSKCVDKIETLAVINCELTGDDLFELFVKISTLLEPVKWIFLNGNPLGLNGVRHLSKCIYNIESLSVASCNIGEEETECLCVAIGKLKKRMGLFELSCNQIGLNGIKSLSKCLHNISSLSLVSSNIGNNEILHLCPAIQALRKPMDLLQLSENPIDDTGAGCLSKCLNNIVTLEIRNCKLSDAGVEMLGSCRYKEANLLPTTSYYNPAIEFAVALTNKRQSSKDKDETVPKTISVNYQTRYQSLRRTMHVSFLFAVHRHYRFLINLTHCKQSDFIRTKSALVT